MDKVKITCYGKTDVMERKDAMNYYRDCIDNSEGSERERYMNIFLGLLDGLTEVNDERW